MQAVWVRGSDTTILLPAVVELTTSAEIQDSPPPEAFPVAPTYIPRLRCVWHLFLSHCARQRRLAVHWSCSAAVELLGRRSLQLIQGQPSYKAVKDAARDELAEPAPLLLSRQEVDRIGGNSKASFSLGAHRLTPANLLIVTNRLLLLYHRYYEAIRRLNAWNECYRR